MHPPAAPQNVARMGADPASAPRKIGIRPAPVPQKVHSQRRENGGKMLTGSVSPKLGWALVVWLLLLPSGAVAGAGGLVVQQNARHEQVECADQYEERRFGLQRKGASKDHVPDGRHPRPIAIRSVTHTQSPLGQRRMSRKSPADKQALACVDNPAHSLEST